MTEREACLVDVYETLLSCDFEGHRAELPALAGVTAEAWAEGYRTIGAATGIGQLSTAEGYERVLRAGGAEARPDLVRALVDLDRELLLRYARLYDDAIPFLRGLRSRGIKIAIVSNCSEHTRDLLESNGVAALADVMALSCEVGAFKPAAEIYTYSLDQLGVPARARGVRRRSAVVLRGRGGPGDHRGADRPGRAGREGAGPGDHGGPVAARSRGHVLSVLTARRRARRPGTAPR